MMDRARTLLLCVWTAAGECLQGVAQQCFGRGQIDVADRAHRSLRIKATAIWSPNTK